MNIYGDAYPIVKLECLAHVLKRMRGCLRKLKASMQNEKLIDFKNINR